MTDVQVAPNGQVALSAEYGNDGVLTSTVYYFSGVGTSPVSSYGDWRDTFGATGSSGRSGR